MHMVQCDTTSLLVQATRDDDSMEGQQAWSKCCDDQAIWKAVRMAVPVALILFCSELKGPLQHYGSTTNVITVTASYLANRASRPSIATTSSSSSENSSSSRQEDVEEPDPTDNGEIGEDPIEWHDGHWDMIGELLSPYTTLEPGLDWINTRIYQDERSVPSDEAHENPTVQQWLQKFAGLRRSDLPTLPRAIGDISRVKIPLYKDEDTGDEYQICLDFGDFRDGLENISCPERQQLGGPRHPLREIRYRIPPPEQSSQPNTPPPRFVIPLGPLAIRTVSHHRHYKYVERPPTEETDYQVMLDAGSENMPLWIFCSRRMLRERYETYGESNLQLPIFNGAMKSEDCEYDTACILESVHQLGGRPRLEEACEMVRKTRAVLDPGSMRAPVAKLEELIGGPLPNNTH
ncbi:hypothetical protein VMCG_04170 [Cytospora schulzeri]|uniref:Uncharacterized protein n=1 Tax=Cytospora schulzeri TaxID=448051 RepID=A0A423WUJ2_9PEZI|nr:hypothetical protein VMCG_04170 [Valsa malicola]